jgi:hypothetical protein
MQIHELTSKHCTVTEGPIAALKGIGTVAAQGINNALGTNIGGAASGAYVGAGGAAQGAAAKLNEPLIQQLANKIEANYSVSVASLLKQNKQLNPATIPDPQLGAPLDAEIRRFLGFDYKTLPNIIGPGEDATLGTNHQQAVVYAAQIEDLVDKILADTKTGGLKYLKTEFLSLARLLSASKNLQTFSSNKDKGVGSLQLSPAAQKLASDAGLDAAEVVALQKIIAANNGSVSPALKELLGLK